MIEIPKIKFNITERNFVGLFFLFYFVVFFISSYFIADGVEKPLQHLVVSFLCLGFCSLVTKDEPPIVIIDLPDSFKEEEVEKNLLEAICSYSWRKASL